MPTPDVLPRVALYHPWPPFPVQPIDSWIKSMLLFFDGVAVLAPPQAVTDFAREDTSTVEPLLEQGLFHLLDPRKIIDDNAAEKVLAYLLETAASPEARVPVDALTRTQYMNGLMDWGVVYPSRGMRELPRLGKGLSESAEMIWEELFRRGLAKESSGLHPMLLNGRIWATLEALLAYTLRPAGLNIGLDLHPATNNALMLSDTIHLLHQAAKPSYASVIASDLEEVALDLSAVPLDEVLEFRERHGAQYRAYVAQLRLFVAHLGATEGTERIAAMKERRAELVDAAEELRRVGRTWWRRPIVSLGLGIVGAVVSVTTGGNLPAAILALLSGGAGLAGPSNSASVYSYLFQARGSLAR